MRSNIIKPIESRPETYGVDPDKWVGIVIHGTPLSPEVTHPLDIYHIECTQEALALYSTAGWYLVPARDLDWNQPYHCLTCEESIT